MFITLKKKQHNEEEKRKEKEKDTSFKGTYNIGMTL